MNPEAGLRNALADPAAVELRRAIRAGARPECTRCVCSMWREPAEFEAHPPGLTLRGAA